jgi:hypothetical protein
MTDWEKFVFHLKLHYNLTPEEVEPGKSPGYWFIKEYCGGAGHCRNPIHGTLFNHGPMRHTVSYRDEPRDRKTGRWASPYRTWKEAVRLWMIEESRKPSPTLADEFIKDEVFRETARNINKTRRTMRGIDARFEDG